MSTVAAALSVALLTTPPPPVGLHDTPSRLILSWYYMKRWEQTSTKAVQTCSGCHMVIVPKRRKDLRGTGRIGYGPPAEIPIPGTALLLGSGIGALVIARKWRKA